MNKYIRVGGVPLNVSFKVQFGIPLLVSINRLDGTNVTQFFSPDQLERICEFALREQVNS
jgi:hypothetical protein